MTDNGTSPVPPPNKRVLLRRAGIAGGGAAVAGIALSALVAGGIVHASDAATNTTPAGNPSSCSVDPGWTNPGSDDGSRNGSDDGSGDTSDDGSRNGSDDGSSNGTSNGTNNGNNSGTSNGSSGTGGLTVPQQNQQPNGGSHGS
jgi:hypothetical protein